MPLSIELGSVIAGMVAVIVTTSAVTRIWVRSTLRMDQFERDLLQLRERVIRLEGPRAAAGRP